MTKPATPALTSIDIGTRWKSASGRIWVVIEKGPFGKVGLKQEDRFVFHDTTQKQMRLTLEPV